MCNTCPCRRRRGGEEEENTCLYIEQTINYLPEFDSYVHNTYASLISFIFTPHPPQLPAPPHDFLIFSLKEYEVIINIACFLFVFIYLLYQQSAALIIHCVYLANRNTKRKWHLLPPPPNTLSYAPPNRKKLNIWGKLGTIPQPMGE